MSILPAEVAASLSREPLSIEESFAQVQEEILQAVSLRLKHVRIILWENVTEVKGALIALGYSIETEVQQTHIGSPIPVAEYTFLTIRW
jgi:hypothetical protein